MAVACQDDYCTGLLGEPEKPRPQVKVLVTPTTWLKTPDGGTQASPDHSDLESGALTDERA